MATRTEGYTKYSQVQRIGLEIIDPRGRDAYKAKRYADLMRNHKKYGIKSLYDNRFVIEGRFVYDCFVLNEKADAIWYQGTAIGG